MFSKGNGKYRFRKDYTVVTFGLPPIVTCPGAGWCKLICYAGAGRLAMPQAQACQKKRFALSKRDNFVNLALADLGRFRKLDAIRLHDSGDIYNSVYLGKWWKIAQARPDVTFFGYTKMIPMIKNLREKLPSNLRLIFSMGGKWDNLIDVNRDNHSKVFRPGTDLGKYKISPDNLPLSFHENHNREAFYYHGSKHWETCMAGK